eukprot:817214-Rhodomonas_salina.6
MGGGGGGMMGGGPPLDPSRSGGPFPPLGGEALSMFLVRPYGEELSVRVAASRRWYQACA